MHLVVPIAFFCVCLLLNACAALPIEKRCASRHTAFAHDVLADPMAEYTRHNEFCAAEGYPIDRPQFLQQYKEERRKLLRLQCSCEAGFLAGFGEEHPTAGPPLENTETRMALCREVDMAQVYLQGKITGLAAFRAEPWYWKSAGKKIRAKAKAECASIVVKP